MIEETNCSQEFFEGAASLPCVNVQHFSARKPTINATFTQAEKYKENASEYNLHVCWWFSCEGKHLMNYPLFFSCVHARKTANSRTSSKIGKWKTDAKFS